MTKPDGLRTTPPKLHPSTLAWSRTIRKIDRLNSILARKDFGPDRKKFTQPIYAEIAKLREQTS